MNLRRIDVKNLPHRDYLGIFEQLHYAANLGSVSSCLGWIFYWLAKVPDSLIPTGMLCVVFYMVGMIAGLTGAGIMILTNNRFGSKKDQMFLLLQISYSILAALLGLILYFLSPA
jgi:hypothetical protein